MPVRGPASSAWVWENKEYAGSRIIYGNFFHLTIQCCLAAVLLGGVSMPIHGRNVSDLTFDTDQLGIFIDMIKEGFIYIDKDTRIRLYNKRAKEIFGIDKSVGIGHPSGSIKKGDIVIIGDNCLGKDDAGLKPESLCKIGIFDGSIQETDIFMAVGAYEEESIKPVYRYYHQSESFQESFRLDAEILGLSVSVVIDGKSITISFGGESFTMNYNNAIGHMVVVNRNTCRVKFYQTNGYTARGEGILDLLGGRAFRAKGPSASDFNV